MTWSREDLLDALIEQAPGYVALLEGAELRVTYANKASSELLGVSLHGRSLRELFAGTGALETMEKAYATGGQVTVTDAPLLLRDGPHAGRYFTRTYTPLRDHEGKVQAMLVVAHEVTRQVEALQAQEARLQRGREELERMFALFEEAPVKLTVLEPPDWKLVLANRAVRQRFGDRVHIGAMMRELLPPTHPTLAAIERVYATGRHERVEEIGVVEHFAGRVFSVSIAPVRDREGSISHVLCATLDITEQVQAGERLKAQARDLELARQEAVAAGRAKDQFLAMLGHELRNPLQPIQLAVQLMQLEGSSQSELDVVERGVRHMTRLVDDLLDISRISRGTITLELEPLELRSIIDRGLELASPLLKERRHRLTVELGPGLSVAGDPQRLAQVVSNLLQNAAKYSNPDSQIRIAAERSGDRVVLTVSDDGVGIEEEMLGRVFHAFVQADQPLARSEGGLGLGLAIVKSLVEAHGGVVSARSDGIGRGSTFCVELPAIDPARVGAGSVATRAELPGAGPSQLRVLVVDDNIGACDMLGAALHTLGYRVALAYDGPAALELAKSAPPQIALLDIGLPGMDGYELGQLLRASLDIPIIAITGYGQPIDRERSRAAGFAAHLVKPAELGRIVETIGAVAGSHLMK